MGHVAYEPQVSADGHGWMARRPIGCRSAQRLVLEALPVAVHCEEASNGIVSREEHPAMLREGRSLMAMLLTAKIFGSAGATPIRGSIYTRGPRPAQEQRHLA